MKAIQFIIAAFVFAITNAGLVSLPLVQAKPQAKRTARGREHKHEPRSDCGKTGVFPCRKIPHHTQQQFRPLVVSLDYRTFECCKKIHKCGLNKCIPI